MQLLHLSEDFLDGAIELNIVATKRALVLDDFERVWKIKNSCGWDKRGSSRRKVRVNGKSLVLKVSLS